MPSGSLIGPTGAIMKVYAKLFASLMYGRATDDGGTGPGHMRTNSAVEVELEENSTLSDLLSRLGVAEDEVRLTFVNGRSRRLDYRLAPQDRVGIFPPIGGG